MPEAISGRDLTIAYDKRVIVANQDLHIQAHTITGLIGPNGSGKSTVLKAIAGINPLTSGTIQLFDQPLASFSAKALAKQLAYLAQSPQVPGDLTVANLVAFGRYSYRQGLWGKDAQGDTAVRAAMVQAKVADLANRSLASLSGGQRQRAFIAMTLAHEAPIIMLDEPTTYLDLTHQLDILNLMQAQNRQADKTVVVVLHDLNQAARYCDQLVCIHDGKIVANGTPSEVLTKDLLADVFEVSAELIVPTGCDYPQLLKCQTLVNA